MQINILWDQSAAGAPPGFATAVNAACAIMDKLIGDNITVSIQFGWGTAGPVSNPTAIDIRNSTTFVGESLTSWLYIANPTLASVQTAFSQLASRYALSGMTALISTSTLEAHANGFQGDGWLAIAYPQALVLGIAGQLGTPQNGGVGYVALNPTTPWNFDPSVAPAPGSEDAIASLLHEISEDLGRVGGWTSNSQPVVTLLDLFRYSAVGVPQLSPHGGYFSVNGATLTSPYAATNDPGDWAASVSKDPFGVSIFGAIGTSPTKTDLAELAALGYYVPTAGPSALFATPGPGTSTATSGATITLQFDEAINRGAGSVQIFNAADGSVYESINATDTAHLAISGTNLVLTPPVPLTPGHSYYVTLQQGVANDALGIPFIGSSGSSWYAFSTNPTSQEVGRWFSQVLREGPSGPHGAAAIQIESDLNSGKDSMAVALKAMLAAAADGSSVATLSYEFFTGGAPGAGGMDYLVSPTGPNPNNLNSAYFQSFNIVNRYINFAVNLGAAGAGEAAFSASYGGLSLSDATTKAYTTIFGSAPTAAKVQALLDPVVETLNGHTLTRADYFATYGGDGLNGLGTKAAMVGWLIAQAVSADLGTYALSNDAFLTDVALHNAPFGVDIIGHYGQPGFAYTGG